MLARGRKNYMQRAASSSGTVTIHEGVAMSKVIADLQQTQGVFKLLWVFVVTVVLYNMTYGVATLAGASNAASIVNRVLDGADEAAADGDTLMSFLKEKFVDEFLDPSGEVRLRAMAAGMGELGKDLRCLYSSEELQAAGIPGDAFLNYNQNTGRCGVAYDCLSARALCKAENMTLPVIHSEQENKALQRVEPEKLFWLGLSAPTETGPWIWADGTKLDGGFTYWGTDNPNDGDQPVCAARSSESWETWGWFDKPSKGHDLYLESEGNGVALVCQDQDKKYAVLAPDLPAKITIFPNRTLGDLALWLDFNTGRAEDSSKNQLEIEAADDKSLQTTRVQGRTALCPPAGGIRLPARPLALNMGCDGPGAIELGSRERWCEQNAAFTWETQIMPNLVASVTSSTSNSIIFGQVRDPFKDAAVLTLRHNDSALFLFGEEVPGPSLPTDSWSHVAVTRINATADNQIYLQVWVDNTLRKQQQVTNADINFELREVGVGAGVCLDDVIITRDNDGGERPCGDHICLNDFTKATHISYVDIQLIGKKKTVAGSIAALMTGASFDPAEAGKMPNGFWLDGQLKETPLSQTWDTGKLDGSVSLQFWMGNYAAGEGVEGPLLVGGGTHYYSGTFNYGILVALLLIGIIILVAELFFDVRTTQSFIQQFALRSVFGKKEDGMKSRFRDRAPTGSAVWQQRKEKLSQTYWRALVRHYFDPKCNAFSNLLDTFVGGLFVGWSIQMMVVNQDGGGKEAFAMNLVISGVAFVLVAMWSLTFFRFHPGLRIFTSTVWNAGPDLVDTIVVMVFLMLCFALATHSWMGLFGSMTAYADLSHSFFTLGEMAFTGISFDDFATEGRGKKFIGLGLDRSTTILKYVIFWMMVFIFTIVMANLLIAVISDAYEEARGERDETRQRISAPVIILRKAWSIIMTPVYGVWYYRKRDTSSVGYRRWRRDWFALTPAGLRLVAACTNPFTQNFMKDAAVFTEVNAAAKENTRGFAPSETAAEETDEDEQPGSGEGSKVAVAAAGILEEAQLKLMIEKNAKELKGVTAELIMSLYGREWTQSEVVWRGNIVMEKWRRALPDGWRGTSATERGCARAVERSPKILQMEKSIKKIETNMKEQIAEVKNDIGEIKQMMRVLLERR